MDLTALSRPGSTSGCTSYCSTAVERAEFELNDLGTGFEGKSGGGVEAWPARSSRRGKVTLRWCRTRCRAASARRGNGGNLTTLEGGGS